MQPAVPKTSYERSRVCVQFGDLFEQAPISISFQIHANETKSQEQIESLKALVGENIDLDCAIVMKLESTDKEKFKQTIMSAFNSEKFLKKHLLIKVHSDENFVYCSIKLNSENEAEYLGIIQVLLDGGMSQLAQEQENNIEGSLELNYNFETVDELMTAGERLGGVLLRNAKFEMNINLHNQFSEKIKKIVSSIDPDFLESPPMVIISYFKNYDIDLTLHSTEDLPVQIKNQVLFGKKLSSIPKEQRKMRVERFPALIEAIETVGSTGTIYFTIQGLVAAQIEIKVPTLGPFILNYGKAIVEIMRGINVPDGKEEATEQQEI